MNVGFFILIFFLAAFPVSAQSKVLINEFLIEPSPQSVELINIGGEDVDISGWHIDDSGGSAYFTIPQGTVLSPNTCISFSSEFNLNKTTQDTIRLFTVLDRGFLLCALPTVNLHGKPGRHRLGDLI
ncbi:lamin tail domain-containing protein [Candidatus Roizmanbacteria bacterium]|nr:lamin tail domain-containing protein [Candidatus Roizmanbacteria bacterium]